MQNVLEKFMIDRSITAVPLSKQDKWLIQQKWREVYALEIKNRTGRWSIDDVDWHILTYDYIPYLKGARAENEFDQIQAKEFYCVCSDNRIPAYSCMGTSLPKSHDFMSFVFSSLLVFDLYVSALNFDWTMVFVHEPTIGPFFSDWGQRQPSLWPGGPGRRGGRVGPS